VVSGVRIENVGSGCDLIDINDVLGWKDSVTLSNRCALSSNS
jgi:hypothetical protein